MTPEEAARGADLGKPSARKAGRNTTWPYVPIIITTDDVGFERQSQILGQAYETRDEAVLAASRHIDALRRQLAGNLAQPNNRALRRWHGVE
jgi:hypothetical protein